MLMSKDEKIKLRPYKLTGIPFAWQDVRTMWFIREHFRGRKKSTAIAIYQTFTELASKAGRGKGEHLREFQAYLGKIATESGKSISTIKRYIRDFRLLKIISWERRKKGYWNLASKWQLLDYPGSYNEPASIPDNELASLGQNNEPISEEGLRSFINKKGKSENIKIYKGTQSFKEIVDDIKNK